MGERLEGTVATWGRETGYGFITRDDGGGDVFAHHRDLGGGHLRVSFEVAVAPNGKPKAVNMEGPAVRAQCFSHDCFHGSHDCFHGSHDCFHGSHDCFHGSHDCLLCVARRTDGSVRPVVDDSAPAVVRVDARCGFAPGAGSRQCKA
eukprot:gene51155-35335_t